MDKISKSQFISGAFWKVSENLVAKGVSFIISLVLARLLSPDAYGIIAITNTFTALSDVLIEGGFSTTLIRKKEVDKCDYNCVFIASFSIATVLYFVFFWMAPFVASFYESELLCPVLRVIGLVLFVQAFSSTRNAVVQRQMKFKLLFYCNMIACFISGVLGIIVAFAGFGVWALVIQQLSQQVIVTFLLFRCLRWNIEWQFQWSKFKQIIQFSIGVVGASLLNYLGTSIYNLIIGKKYSVTDLGYSDKGAQMPMQVSLYTFGAMSSVLLSTLSSYQDCLEDFKRILRKVVRMTAYLVFPMMIGMASISEELIIVLLTDKWLPSLCIMQCACLYYIATPFMLVNIQVFYALGHGFLRVKTELIRTILLIVSLVIFSFFLGFNISELAFVSAIIAVVMAIVTFFEVKKIIPYAFVECAQDILKPLVSALVMGGIVFFVNKLLQDNAEMKVFLRMIIDISIGVIFYCFMSRILKIDSYNEIVNIIKSRQLNG